MSLQMQLVHSISSICRQWRHWYDNRMIERGELSWRGRLRSWPGKIPALDRESKAYAAATSELLRWRARVAAAQAATKGTDFAPITQRFHAGTLSGNVNGANYLGLFQPPPATETQPQLQTASPDIMPIAVQRLVGQKTTVRDVIRTAPDSKMSIARYSTRTYATIPAPLATGPEVEQLKLDLMVSEQAPPLSLAATQAIVTAERGDMVAIGGEISGVHLEAVRHAIRRVTCVSSAAFANRPDPHREIRRPVAQECADAIRDYTAVGPARLLLYESAPARESHRQSITVAVRLRVMLHHRHSGSQALPGNPLPRGSASLWRLMVSMDDRLRFYEAEPRVIAVRGRASGRDYGYGQKICNVSVV